MGRNNIELPIAQHRQLKDWSNKVGIPIARLVRRLLLLFPFNNLDHTDLIVLKLPRNIANDPERLQEWLTESSIEITNHYQNPIEPPDKSGGNPNST